MVLPCSFGLHLFQFYQHSQLLATINKALHLQLFYILLQYLDTILHHELHQSTHFVVVSCYWMDHSYLLSQWSYLYHQILWCHSEDHWLIPRNHNKLHWQNHRSFYDVQQLLSQFLIPIHTDCAIGFGNLLHICFKNVWCLWIRDVSRTKPRSTSW